MKNLAIWLSILCIPLYGFFTFPQWGKLKENTAQAFLLEKNLNAKTEKIKNLEKIKSTFDQTKVEEILQKVPLKMNQDLLMMDIKRIAESSGFIFEGFTFSESKDPALEIKTLSVSFNIKGRKDRLYRFFEKMEENKRFLKMDELNTSMTDINGVSLITLGVNIKSYFQE